MKVLHTFDGAVGGASPYDAPIEGRDGYFYGTTGGGGEFGETEDAGAYPVGEQMYADDGALYGTTVFGGAFGQGTASRFRLK